MIRYRRTTQGDIARSQLRTCFNIAATPTQPWAITGTAIDDYDRAIRMITMNALPQPWVIVVSNGVMSTAPSTIRPRRSRLDPDYAGLQQTAARRTMPGANLDRDCRYDRRSSIQIMQRFRSRRHAYRQQNDQDRRCGTTQKHPPRSPSAHTSTHRGSVPTRDQDGYDHAIAGTSPRHPGSIPKAAGRLMAAMSTARDEAHL